MRSRAEFPTAPHSPSTAPHGLCNPRIPDRTAGKAVHAREWERTEEHGGTPEQGLAPTTPAWSSWHTATLPALLRHRLRTGCHGQRQCEFGAPGCVAVIVMFVFSVPVLILVPVPDTGHSTSSTPQLPQCAHPTSAVPPARLERPKPGPVRHPLTPVPAPRTWPRTVCGRAGPGPPEPPPGAARAPPGAVAPAGRSSGPAPAPPPAHALPAPPGRRERGGGR